MTRAQRQHLEYVLKELCSLLTDKYRRGAREHGGDLLTMTTEQLVMEAVLENVDQAVYLLTALRKMRRGLPKMGTGIPKKGMAA